ncbi:prepilin-type N-terminal cleavage/methylation domain-containing protein [Ideonella paludis]|uniref:Prepilin-type N-terminal cleavage/methylation domain-containing protein n=1 Tax=Ideonella paludis TaxID=1233411 RepID=A0ABS5E3D1_9BURK|nr:prepilin-type N-terminal cleavage/methylation domain-containing protein [Ideonella paludis]MBQ0937814.1 prepilin-type N-terminal cleavage/methylation domain-containing protein [Ideonella paludis]
MRTLHRHSHRGFSLLELSVVLVVITLILSMVNSGRSVLFGAKATASYWTFVQDWKASFQEYRQRTNAMPADSVTNPTTYIKQHLNKNGATVTLCNAPGNFELSNAFLAKGVSLPEREARAGRPDILLYTDDEGIGHTSEMCLLTHEKSVPGTSVGTFNAVAKPAMLIKGLHYSMAQQIDLLMDGSHSTRFGSVRDLRYAADTGTPSAGADCWGDAAVQCNGQYSSRRFTDVIIFLE